MISIYTHYFIKPTFINKQKHYSCNQMFAGSDNREPTIQEHRTGLTGIGHAPPPRSKKSDKKRKGPPPFQLPPNGPLGSGTPHKKTIKSTCVCALLTIMPDKKKNKRNT